MNISENSPVGMTVCDSTEQCIAAKKAIGDMIGATREQVLVQKFNYLESWGKSGLW